MQAADSFGRAIYSERAGRLFCILSPEVKSLTHHPSELHQKRVKLYPVCG